ncbi:hypothetical protein LP417_15980 [Polaromonas sp. P1-6]|nr:hypothetical protein LP417_15980 [Polaromonas sp. P1-6]
MFAVFLPSLNFRGNRSPYLWWFYKFLSEFGERAGYICGDEYFLDPKIHLDNARSEASDEIARHHQYQIPDCKLLSELPRADIADHVWQSLERLFPENPLAAFRYFCLNDDELLSKALTQALDQLESSCGEIEAVITCINCATLQRLCNEKNLPLLHIELGPLRSPQYLQTAYFDFSGVNGGTESRQRFNAVDASVNDLSKWHEVDVLRSLFMMAKRRPSQAEPRIDLGIGLQVEDDSNIICYSNGFSSLTLLNNSRRLLAEKRIKAPVLVRGHPSSFFSPKNLPPGLSVDQSESAIDFIQQCKEIHTVNSSLALESLLQGRKAVVYGDSPFAFCIDINTHQCDESALSFFLLNYLVPWKLAISVDYIRWRLGNPVEGAIRDVHVEFYMREKIRLLEARVAELEQTVMERDGQIAQLKSSFSWYLSYPLRVISETILYFLKAVKK